MLSRPGSARPKVLTPRNRWRPVAVKRETEGHDKL
jgi:hypothetical protein